MKKKLRSIFIIFLSRLPQSVLEELRDFVKLSFGNDTLLIFDRNRVTLTVEMFNNILFRMNLFSFQQLAGYRCRSFLSALIQLLAEVAIR